MKIGIVLGSIRDGRKGESVARWVQQVSASRGDADYQLLDLKEFAVPLLTSGTHPMQADRRYDSELVTAWSRAVDACDGFVFVTPEYNHGVPGAMKNAVDVLGPEWVGKTAAFVGYGSVGGVRAIENWRTVIANFSMVDVRAEVNLSVFTEFDGSQVTPSERRGDEVTAMLDQLIAVTRTVSR